MALDTTLLRATDFDYVAPATGAALAATGTLEAKIAR